MHPVPDSLEQHRDGIKQANYAFNIDLGFKIKSVASNKMTHIGKNYVLFKYNFRFRISENILQLRFGFGYFIIQIDMDKKKKTQITHIRSNVSDEIKFLKAIDYRTLLITKSLRKEQVKKQKREMRL